LRVKYQHLTAAAHIRGMADLIISMAVPPKLPEDNAKEGE
jgi:hypothetical protein